MTFDGIITYIGPKETVGQNALPKQSFVLQENSDKEYKSTIMIDLLKEKIELLQGYSVGDSVKVSLNFRANEYNGRRYNSITARKIEGQTSGGSSKKSAADEEDLPF
ncbi:MAG TPA: DUF3127 domain-containing protein [Candidatus Absconditabacterales bacterium]|nr:DUF3127 domain-containing protein [Candidatus Absconditabacterales bacterium]